MHRSNKGPQQNNPTNNSFLINFCFLFLFWYISVTTNTISFIYVATSVHKVNNNLGVREMKNTPACLKIFSALLLLTSLLYILIAPSSPSIHENLQPHRRDGRSVSSLPDLIYSLHFSRFSFHPFLHYYFLTFHPFLLFMIISFLSFFFARCVSSCRRAPSDLPPLICSY